MLIQEYNDIVNLSGDKPVWISETGWPSNGSCANGAAVPNAANQERYLREVMEWTSGQSIVLSWFDAFEALYKDGSEWCNVVSHVSKGVSVRPGCDIEGLNVLLFCLTILFSLSL